MATQKPSKPNVTLPNNFGGVKTPYTQTQIDNGYQEAVPQVVDGGNVNYEKDGIFQKLKYTESIADVINGTPVKKVVEVDANNNFDYSRIGVYAYETTRTFSKDEISVSVESDGQVALYRSLANNNTGNSLKNGNFWEQISLGGGGGLKVGTIGISLWIDESKNMERYLNGQVISSIQFLGFLGFLKKIKLSNPSLFTTEENWQAEVTNSKLGQCGKFVIDDTAGTIRLPKVVNINGLTDLSLMGGIKAESLPNITGTFRGRNAYNGNASKNKSVATGAFGTRDESETKSGAQESGTNSFTWTFNASRSSSTYQDNAPVQQEAIQYPYFIQVATGSEESVDVTREIELNNPFSLLDYKWSEYEITNASWLLSNGQFNSGATYVAVYELLLKIHNGTETKDGVSVKLSTEAYTDTDFVLNTADTTFRLPIKVKLASGNAVAGNGMSLGLTNGTVNYGLASSDVAKFGGASNQYGKPVGITQSGSWQPTGGDGYGITTDPTKSGIETSSSGLKLYFYVGETIQDANVIAASQVLTTVADCVRKSSATDRETVVGWGMPDYSAGIDVTSEFSAGQWWTATKAGWYVISAGADSYFEIRASDNGKLIVAGASPTPYILSTGTFVADVGQRLYCSAKSGSYPVAVYYPFKGAN